jgi:hypothetical protein
MITGWGNSSDRMADKREYGLLSTDHRKAPPSFGVKYIHIYKVLQI